MTLSSATLAAFVGAHSAAIVAELVRVRGSTPREQGAFMLVAADAVLGTIGGGALEHMVIARARQVLRDGLSGDALDIPLGPEIGQCCGGRVEVSLRGAGPDEQRRLLRRLQDEEASRPTVYLYGAGHVGRALATALAPLPLRVTVIDTRPDTLEGLPQGVVAKATPMPEAMARSAPQGTSHVILTHDHALDFLIAREALTRSDAPYVGMVGSVTKRARFAAWFREAGGTDAQIARLFLPIGGTELRDKRPEVIAALAAAEIMIAIGKTARSAMGDATAAQGLEGTKAT
jgi:xanthine dehydrogenase accessory factor